MRLDLLAKTLRDQRRSLIGWSATTAVLAFLITLIYPSYKEQAAAFEQFWEQAPTILRSMLGEEFDFGTPEGFLGAEIYSSLAPLIFAIFAIAAGSKAIAGEEQDGTLDVLMAHPLSRRRIVVEKFLAMITTTMVIAAALVVALILGILVIGVDLNIPRLIGATVLTALLGLAFGAMAFAIGASLRGKGRAIGLATGAAVVTFLLNGLAPLVSWLEPLQGLTPWHWLIRNAPLRNGLVAADVTVLAGIVVAMLAIAVVGFERRDVAV